MFYTVIIAAFSDTKNLKEMNKRDAKNGSKVCTTNETLTNVIQRLSFQNNYK